MAKINIPSKTGASPSVDSLCTGVFGVLVCVGTIDDPNYRYKMPKLMAKTEGRGNGIKTNIVNMADIARALKRPPGCEQTSVPHTLTHVDTQGGRQAG